MTATVEQEYVTWPELYDKLFDEMMTWANIELNNM